MTKFKGVDFDLCVGTVTVVTVNDLILIGRILRDDNSSPRDLKAGNGVRHEDSLAQCVEIGDTVEVEFDPEFITLKLTEPLFAVPGSGDPPVEQPYYEDGDIIQINVAKIVTVSPSRPIF
ncbi:hypothetical protein SOV_38620 [Sporomusa ovata DSM 2662]|uniref:Uncharacterized protein n=1 Tax=Sporomusa ovata TaxID=2378 RepID=A0A0U1KSF3_9FIRM|nr:hypothetical protein [Sporomusa ovata]EQB26250.1 hypothetical protein SOV_3c01240 [Sporomusa ovata DSM 2662]CQR70327.1 hypothetical protein SpAn4DRAFT_1296 [Sporomusa ovata]